MKLPAIRSILSAVARKVSTSEVFTSQNFGMSMLGLRGLSSDAKEMGGLFNALITVMPRKLDAQALANSLYSLQSTFIFLFSYCHLLNYDAVF